MESEIVWDKFRSPGLLDPYIVHFPNYTKGELYLRMLKTRYFSQPVTVLSKPVFYRLLKCHRPKRSCVLELFKCQTTSAIFWAL